MRKHTDDYTGQTIDLDASPTTADRLATLAARNQQWVPSYAAEKVGEVMMPQSMDYLLGPLDEENRARFFVIRAQLRQLVGE